MAGVIENSGRELIPDANVNVEIRTRVANNALTVPKEALRRRADKTGVYVLNGNTLRWRPVEIGASDITKAEIVSGLKEGDVAATGAGMELRDGMRVRATVRDILRVSP